MTGARRQGKSALKPLKATGDYLGTWVLPHGDGATVELPGQLTLAANATPEGVAYGGVPWISEDPPGVRSFPNYSQLERVVFRLANGGSVLLTDVTLDHGINDDARVYASAAVVSDGDLCEVDSFAGVRFQVEYLDAIAGSAPLASVHFPKKTGTYSGELNDDAGQVWTDDTASVDLGYQGMLHSIEVYQLHLGFSPVVEVTTSEPIPFAAWRDDWIDPLRKVVSVAVGRPASLTYVELKRATPADEVGWGSRCQVFGTAIAQSPFESQQANIQRVESPLQLKPDGVSLLDLVRTWQAMAADHHPLIETYGAMLHATDQHPRSRFLLLLQAIEGTYGHETRGEYAEAVAKHTSKRDEVVAAAADVLNEAQTGFLNRNLAKWPAAGLESALNWLRKELPGDIRKRLDATAIVKMTREAPDDATTAADALRMIRNNLAHGRRGYDLRDLHEVVRVLEQIVRAHALHLLGCPDTVIKRVLK